MDTVKSGKERLVNIMYYFVRIAIILNVVLMLFPGINPAKVCDYIGKNMSLLTTGTNYSQLTENCIRAFDRGWVQESSFIILFVSSMIACIGIVVCIVTGCMSLGNDRMRKFGNWFAIGGSLVEIIGLVGILVAYSQINATERPDKVIPEFQTTGFVLFITCAIIILVFTAIIQAMIPKVDKEIPMEMESKYKLFLMFLPFAALAFVFSYLPLWGWRYAFFDYSSGGTLSKENFVGFKWFVQLFENEATRADIVRVLRNTLAMSGLGIATSWCAMAFAIFLAEIKSPGVRRFVQTFSTVPNFISWVLVYAFALAIFATDGFVSSLFTQLGIWENPQNLLMNTDHMWLKMLAWGMWKGLGWSAIIYIAAISGIDQQLYEAATVDGAGRFQKMWHITVPCLVPTYMVLLLMSVAGILSNGMDQYMVFENSLNSKYLTVLDLYVYKLGIDSGAIPLSTVIGMTKSIISVALLFMANGVSKLVRGESIV